MTNFDFLLEEKKFSGFANTAITAEKLYQIGLDHLVGDADRP